MKQIRLTKILAASLLCAASLGLALAQTTTTTTSTDPVTDSPTTQQTTTSSAGNIVTYTPDSDYFMFRTACRLKVPYGITTRRIRRWLIQPVAL